MDAITVNNNCYDNFNKNHLEGQTVYLKPSEQVNNSLSYEVTSK